MDALPPRANPLLVGHADAEATIAEAVRARRVHHAWLITGAEGIGKATLAFRFARCLLAGEQPAGSLVTDPASPVFRRVAAGAHADLLTVERAYDPKRKRMRTQIAVEDVRRINPFMALTPAEGGWRVVVVDGAEDLNQASANALLKILEEPPPRAVLLLVCNAPGRLLPTIRSRCRRLRLSPLSYPEMTDLLARYLPDMPNEARDRLAALSDGSPGRALMLADEEGLAVATLVDKVMAELPVLSPSRGYEIADALGRSETGFSTFMELLRGNVSAAVRDVARGQADAAQEKLIACRSLDAWTEVWHGLTRLQDETERFALDKRQALVASLAMLGARAP